MSWSVHDAALKSNSTLETVEIKGRVINVASLFIVQEFREFRFKLYRCTCPIIIYIRIFSIYPQKSYTKLMLKDLPCTEASSSAVFSSGLFLKIKKTEEVVTSSWSVHWGARCWWSADWVSSGSSNCTGGEREREFVQLFTGKSGPGWGWELSGCFKTNIRVVLEIRAES